MIVCLATSVSSSACDVDAGRGDAAEGQDAAGEGPGGTEGDADPSAGMPGGPAEGEGDGAGSDGASSDGASPDATDDGTGGGASGFELESSTYFGGSGFERIQGVHVDDAGFIYVTGNTRSTDFPVTAGAFDTEKWGPAGNSASLSDGYVAKLAPDGATILWATYFGGEMRDSAYAVRTDSQGNVYVVGATGSSMFPTTADAYDPTANGPTSNTGLTDIFVISLTPDGSAMRFGTYLGGSLGGPGENPRGALEIDEARGRIYLSGRTDATNFPVTAGAYQPIHGGGNQDGFVAALSLDGRELLASTYLGGIGSEMAYSELELHPDGSIYVAGGTSSPNFPVTDGAFQTTLRSGGPGDAWWEDGDGFVTRLTPDLDDVVFSTFIGGNGSDSVGHNQGIGVDSQGRLVMAGTTSSTDFPVTDNAYRRTPYGDSDGFVAVLAEDGSELEYATYVGGTGNESLTTAFVGPDDRVYVTGTIESDNWPVTGDAYQPLFGNGNASSGYSDAVLSVFDPTLSVLEYSTYLGGSGTGAGAERGRGLWVTADAVYVSGATDSANFPVMGAALQPNYQGGVDGFLVRFSRP